MVGSHHATGGSPRTIRKSRVVLAFALVFATLLLMGLSFRVSAAYGCAENGAIFWSGGDYTTNARGNQQDLVVRAHVSGGCGHFNDLRAGGTVHMSGPPGDNLVETGWRDYIASCCDPDNDHVFLLFNEIIVSGQVSVFLYDDPACTFSGNTVTMRLIRGTTTNVWVAHRKCNGGSWAQLGTGLGTNFWSASPRVETFRAGPSGGGGFILDFHRNLDWKKPDNTWKGSFGTMHCESDWMDDTRGKKPSDPAYEWRTVEPPDGVEC
jgi:hypothetical protein